MNVITHNYFYCTIYAALDYALEEKAKLKKMGRELSDWWLRFRVLLSCALTPEPALLLQITVCNLAAV